MSDSAVLPAVIGLAAGIAFIGIMSLASFETSISYYTSGLIDSVNPRFELDIGNNKQIVDVMLQNSYIVELLRDGNFYLSAIGDMPNGCSFGACAQVYLWERDDMNNFTGGQVAALVDYPNQRVIHLQHAEGQ